MVLMPSGIGATAGGTKSATRSLDVDRANLADFKPMKTSGLEDQSQMPKLKSALKVSTHNLSDKSSDTNNNNNSSTLDTRRGSVGLGRSKSVCHRVKFVPDEGKIERNDFSKLKGVTLEQF